MLKTVVSLFDNQSTAEDAVRALLARGIPGDHISLVTRPATADDKNLPDALKVDSGKNMDANAKKGAGIGAAVGGIGGLLAGLATLIIPGVGPVLATGPLIVALSGISGAGAGAITGASAGGLVGALKETGLTTEQVNSYLEGLREGKILVAVQADDPDIERVRQILESHTRSSQDENPSGSAVLPKSG